MQILGWKTKKKLKKKKVNGFVYAQINTINLLFNLQTFKNNKETLLQYFQNFNFWGGLLKKSVLKNFPI